jgi:hypothetical protein
VERLRVELARAKSDLASVPAAAQLDHLPGRQVLEEERIGSAYGYVPGGERLRLTMYRADKFYGSIGRCWRTSRSASCWGQDRRAGAERSRQVDVAPDHGGAGGAIERRRGAGAGATVGMLAQGPSSTPRGRYENVEDGVRELRDLLDRFNKVSAQFAEPADFFDTLLAEQAKVQDQIDRADAWNLDATLDRAMDALRLPEGDRVVTTLSSAAGSRSRAAPLVADLLLLDEPTNHLDAESVARWSAFEQYKIVVAVTHDRYFLDNVAGLILELEQARGSRSRATTPPGSSRSRRGWPSRRSRSRRAATLAELEWVREPERATRRRRRG